MKRKKKKKNAITGIFKNNSDKDKKTNPKAVRIIKWSLLGCTSRYLRYQKFKVMSPSTSTFLLMYNYNWYLFIFSLPSPPLIYDFTGERKKKN